jgi:peptidoglycan hydrolase FlgJ
MSVDLVLGVIHAADASRSQQTRKKLAGLNEGSGGLFEKVFALSSRGAEKTSASKSDNDLIAGVVAAAKPEAKQSMARQLASLDSAASPIPNSDSEKQAAQQLEESLLAAVVDQMIPKDAPSLYGEGGAAGLARQFQVEHVAAATAETAPLGLADSLYGNQADSKPLKSSQWPYFVRSSITPYAA